MKRILVSLLLIGLVILLFFAWAVSGDSYVTKEMREKFTADNWKNTTTAVQVPPIEQPEAETSAVTEAVTSADTSETTAPTVEAPVGFTEDTVLVFGGDVNLDVRYNALVGEAVNSPASCIEEVLLAEMQSADLFMAGNVFAITDSTETLAKAYTFRTAPANVVFWTKIGADVLSLANNHSVDYTAVGLADTVKTLADAGIATVGAGANSTEAAKVHYFDHGGKRIAITAAMRSEKNVRTPDATEQTAGVMKMYELEPYLAVIRTAKENADFVVAYVHWGTENTNTLEQAQIDGAHALIDAGADVVIGAHTHTLQAVEYYGGKPIFYSLGDLWCNSLTGESGLAKITLAADGSVKAQVLPCVNVGSRTYLAQGDAKAQVLARLNESATVSVDENGVIAAK